MAMIQNDPQAQVLAALRFLDGQCDGASKRDGHGFNKLDAVFGKSMASKKHLTPAMYKESVRMLQKYRKQLEKADLSLPLVVAYSTNGSEQEDMPFDPNIYEIPDDYSPEDDFFFDDFTEEPQPTPEPAKPAPRGRAVEDLRNGGTLSRSLPGYQERGPQLEMAALVEEAITEKKHAIIEAATGTGKSLGYLIPAVRAGKRVVVSTANKALQEQLYGKDVPFLQTHLQEFDAALVKGMGNYVCLDRLEKEQHEGISFYAEDQGLTRVADATKDSKFNGDFELLPFQVKPELRSKINGDPEECARKKCPLYSQCYYYKMRRAATNAQVIITNHALLMLDDVSGGKLLPARDVVVVDEAHMLEGVATDAYTIEIKPSKIYNLLSNKKLRTYTKEETRQKAEEQAQSLEIALFNHMPDDAKKPRIELVDKIESGLKLSETINRLANEMRIKKPILSDKENALYDRVVERTEKLAEDLQDVFAAGNKNYVYYLERTTQGKKGTETISVFMVPLTVAPLLKTFFKDNKVILTSATLSTPGDSGEPDFSFFKRQIGLDGALERILPLVFDYENNSLLYVPDDLDEPAYGNLAEARKYEAALSKRMLDLVEASRGRAFLLFTSRRMMDIVLRHIRPSLEQDDYTVLVQSEHPTSEMIRRFKESDKAVLFGLRTFWEGVDVQGEKLSLVVIDKIPFLPFDDPVNKAKERYIERETGQKPFYTYGLPMATLPLKQGIGRLLRDVNDTGVMVICDTRLFTKPYGKRILACLPPARLVRKLHDVQSFFAAPPRVVEVAPVVESVQEAVIVEEMPVVEPEATEEPAVVNDEPTVMTVQDVVEPENNPLKFALPKIGNKGGNKSGKKGGVAGTKSASIDFACKIGLEERAWLKQQKESNPDFDQGALITQLLKLYREANG